MFEFSRRVDCKYSRDRDTHSSVGVRVIWTVSVTSEEGVPAEQGLDVFQTPDLELLGVPVNDLPLEGVDERGGIEEDGSVRQEDVSLLDTLEVILGYGGLTDGPSTEVHDPVAVLLYLAVQVSHPGVGPVLACDACQVMLITM